MHTFPILTDLGVIFVLAIVVLLIFHRLRLPVVMGYLITGVLCGPYGLGLVQSYTEVEVLAEVGVALLLFVIGMELSLGELKRLKVPVFIGGTAQVVLTALLFAGLSLLFGLTPQHAILVGLLCSLSSTAIVLKLLADRAEETGPHGRIALSFLIFQDIAIVPMVLAVPVLAQATPEGGSLWMLLVKATGVLASVYALARWVVPFLLRKVVNTRSRELFLLTVLGLCLGLALITSLAGMSLTLGAFLAGLILSESEYSLSALEGVLPFKEVFTSFFFVSVGMLLSMTVFLEHFFVVVGFALGVIVLKTIVVTAAAMLTGYPLRPALQAGICLGQIGEFAFVLAGAALAYGLADPEGYQKFLAASILTMLATPFLVASAAPLANRIAALAPTPLQNCGFRHEDHEDGCSGLSDHLIIVGYGTAGRIVARMARAYGVDVAAVELNPETVRSERAKGTTIVHGDGSGEEVLHHVGVERARALVISGGDPAGVRRVVHVAHRLNPELALLTRTRYLTEVGPLQELGACETVVEEFEASLRLGSRTMARLGVPGEERAALEEQLRQASGKSL